MDTSSKAHRSLELRVITDLGEFAELRDRWDAAIQRSCDPSVFLTWEWLTSWWRHFGGAAAPHVVVVTNGDDIVLGSPMMRSRVGFGPVRTELLRTMAHDAGDYLGAFVAPGAPDAVDLLVAHLEEQVSTNPAVAVLPRVPSDSRFLDLLRSSAAGRTTIEVHEEVLGGSCPFTDVRQEFDLRRTGKHHKVFQRQRRLDEAYEQVEYRFHHGEDLEQGFTWLTQVHDLRWADRVDELQGLFSSDAHQAFLHDAARALDQRGWIHLLSLTADGRPVAVDLGFHFASRVLMFKGAIDPEFSAFSPGQLVTYRTFEVGMQRGDVIFDFMRGDHGYKSRWANQERHLVTLTLTRTGWRGQLDRARFRGAAYAQHRRARAAVV